MIPVCFLTSLRCGSSFSQLKEKSPDFRHKETGQGLWLDGLPSWVLAKLPPIKAHEDVATNKSNSVLS